MATLFKAISVFISLAILVPMNLFVVSRCQGGAPWFIIPINIYALACLIPNSWLAKRPKLVVPYILAISISVTCFLIIGVGDESVLTWDTIVFNGLSAFGCMSPVFSMLLYRRKMRAVRPTSHPTSQQVDNIAE